MTTSPPVMFRRDVATPATRTHAPPRVRRSLWVGLALFTGVCAVLLSFAAHRVPYFASDIRVTRSVQAADLGILAPPMHALNALGFPPLVGLVYGGVIVLLFRSGGKWEAAACGFAALGGATTNFVVKALVDRPRPSADLIRVEHVIASPSFPAGHVLNFTAFMGFVCFLVYLRVHPSRSRNAAIAVLLVLIGLMGLARIHSGEHWPSDVLGGYLLGAAWLAAAVLVYDWGRRRFGGSDRNSSRRGLRRAVLTASMLLALPALPAFTGTAGAQPVASDSLGMSTGVPWNPPTVMARRNGWEQAALLPGRIVSLPLVGLGYQTDHLLHWVEQDPRFANGLTPSRGAGRRGIVLKSAWLGDRAGLEGAVEVHQDLLHGALQNRLSAEFAGTMHLYNRTLLTWTGRPMSVQYGYEWRPQDRFYGIGNATPVGDISNFASQSEFVRGNMRWGVDRRFDPAHPHATLLLWGGPRSQITSTGREPGQTSYETRFPELGAATLDRRVEHLVYGGSLQIDHRTGSPHWSHGWRTLLSAERFELPVHALALHPDAAAGEPFSRYQAEIETGFSFMRDPRTVRLLVHVTDQQAGPNPERMLVSDLSTLGGQAGLGGFEPGRFHDLDLLLTRLSYVFPLERSFEMDLHAEWGAVYPDLWSDPKFDTLHESVGFALRIRDARVPRGSIGFDFSREAIRLRFSLGGVL